MRISERSLEDLYLAVNTLKTEEGFLMRIPLDAILTEPFWAQFKLKEAEGFNALPVVYRGPAYYGITSQLEFELVIYPSPETGE